MNGSPERRLRLLLITSEWPPPGGKVRRRAEALHAAGLSVEVFAFRGSRNPFNYIAAWARLRPRLHRHRYDLAHAQWGTDALIAFPNRVPLVVSVGDQVVRGLARLATSWAVRRADAVIVGSEDMRRRVHTRAPVHVIGRDLEPAARTARLVEVYSSVVLRS
ncbi:MAG TPA: glycosyltransferase [Gemmatimonadales bacterium]|nr:glycosyltransferase [Gemmatimonadales bacterium]